MPHAAHLRSSPRGSRDGEGLGDERSGRPAHEIASMLLILELEGYIQSVAGGYLR